MRKSTLRKSTFIISLVVITQFLSCSWYADSTTKDFYNMLLADFHAGESVVKLKDVTDFEWDAVCYYGYGNSLAYHLKHKRLEKYGVYNITHKKRLKLSSIKNTSDATLFAFALDGVVTQLIYTPSQVIDFEGVSYHIKADTLCASSKAVFKIDKGMGEAGSGTGAVTLTMGEYVSSL